MLPAKKAKDAPRLKVLYICFLIAQLLLCAYTSPLYPDYLGYDSAIFSLVGKGVAEGRLLYAELFDHKGPMIFFINALGHVLGGRTGIFALQCIFGLVSLTFLYYACKLLRPGRDYRSAWECLVIFIAGYAVYFFTFQRGNLTEEYSLPFISGALYFFVKYALDAEEAPAHPPQYAFFYGIGIGFLALLRLNNAVGLCVGCVVIVICLILRAEYKNLLWNLLAGCLGIALVMVPVLAYFAWNSALYDMVYATFLYNFQIMGNTSHIPFFSDPLTLGALYLPMVGCGILLLTNAMDTRKLTLTDILLGTLLIGNALLLWAANRYPHYFTVFVPVYILFIAHYLPKSIKRVTAYAIALCTVVNLAVVAYYMAGTAEDCWISDSAANRVAAIRADMDRIPEDERDRVIGYHIPAADYLAGDMIPCYKYYTLQETWAYIDPQIYTDFMQWLGSDRPLWVLTTPGEDDPQLLEILSENYGLAFENSYIRFYRLTG